MRLSFEQGPIRPPSEAESLLLRITRNCPWNKCEFCVTYKKKSFSRRSVDEIKKDIASARAIADEIKRLSWSWGYGGAVVPQMLDRIYREYGSLYYHVAVWLYRGGKTVFLQDANSLVLKTETLVDILNFIRENFPSVERITTYARASTVARKSLWELEELHRAGLSRIHMGMESGSDEVLKYVKKGVTSTQLIEAGRKVKAAGISLCDYIMPGLGGERWSREHALESARVLNAIDPDFIRLRSLSVIPGSPLYEKMRAGDFKPLGEDDMVREIRLFIENLEVNSTLVSDHILNLLEEVEGKLPDAKQDMLSIIDEYLAMPDEMRLNFQLGRRAGIYRYLSDMRDPQRYEYVERGLRQLQDTRKVEDVLVYFRQRFV